METISAKSEEIPKSILELKGIFKNRKINDADIHIVRDAVFEKLKKKLK